MARGASAIREELELPLQDGLPSASLIGRALFTRPPLHPRSATFGTARQGWYTDHDSGDHPTAL